jgi:hypothetical protein
VIQTLIYALDEFHIEEEDEKFKQLFEEVENISSIETTLNGDLASKLQRVWESESIQKAYQQRHEFQFPSSGHYLMENMQRFAKPDFIPSPDDLLRCRARTTGIHEIEFPFKNYEIRTIDVGGPRSERKKWIHCFSGIDLICFLLSYEKIGRVLYEDENVSAWDDQRFLLAEILACKFWTDSKIAILGTHVDTMPTSCTSPMNEVLKLIESAVSCRPVLKEKIAARSGDICVFPDLNLMNFHSSRLKAQVESVLSFAGDANSINAHLSDSYDIAGLGGKVRRVHHPTSEQKSWWIFMQIYHFRKESHISKLPLDVVKLIKQFVF